MRAAKSADFAVIRSLLDGGANPAFDAEGLFQCRDDSDERSRRRSESTILDVIKLCASRPRYRCLQRKRPDVAPSGGSTRQQCHRPLSGRERRQVDMKNKQGRTPMDIALGVGAPAGPGGLGGRGARGGGGGSWRPGRAQSHTHQSFVNFEMSSQTLRSVTPSDQEDA
jgi:hypothetical protein